MPFQIAVLENSFRQCFMYLPELADTEGRARFWDGVKHDVVCILTINPTTVE